MHTGVGPDTGVAHWEEVALRVEGGAIGYNVAEVKDLECADDNGEHRSAWVGGGRGGEGVGK